MGAEDHKDLFKLGKSSLRLSTSAHHEQEEESGIWKWVFLGSAEGYPQATLCQRKRLQGLPVPSSVHGKGGKKFCCRVWG